MAINLLPPKEKKRIQKIYRARRLRATSWLVIVLVLVSIGMLVPVYLLSRSTEMLAETKKQELSRDANSLNPLEVKEEIFLINKKVRVLADNDHTKIYDLFSDITQSKRSGISIVAVSFRPSEISISGNARNRETLLSFRRDLEQKGYSKKVDLPVSNFAQNIDIDFSIKVTLDEEE